MATWLVRYKTRKGDVTETRLDVDTAAELAQELPCDPDDVVTIVNVGNAMPGAAPVVAPRRVRTRKRAVKV